MINQHRIDGFKIKYAETQNASKIAFFNIIGTFLQANKYFFAQRACLPCDFACLHRDMKRTGENLLENA